MELQVGDSLYKCQNCKKDFLIELEDFNFYKKIKVPPPTWCTECRAVRRCAFRNERFLFKKPDLLTGKEIFSAYHKNSPIKIYEHNYWWSDSWDSMSYGRNYDFSRPFFEQFRELQLSVPWASRSISNPINSDYCNNFNDLKNSYLVFSGGPGENLSYGTGLLNLKDAMEFLHSKDSSFLYETFSVVDSYKTFWSTECASCSEVMFSFNCRDCSNCFGCVNLRSKKYHIFNEPYTKEAYEEKIKEFNIGSYASLSALKKDIYNFWKKFPIKYMHTMQSPGSTGDYIYGTKNAKDSFYIYKSENLKYSQNLYRARDSYDYTAYGWESELMYESVVCGENCSNIKFCFECWPNSNDMEYSMECHSCSNCFGCVGLKKKSYCIFNKQYSKEEYAILRQKIIDHMDELPYVDNKGRVYKYGEFFPTEFSPIAYNESLAFDHFPSSKESTEAQGYLWREDLKRNYTFEVNHLDLPDDIRNVGDDLINKSISCEHEGNCTHNCTTAFKIIEEEMKFYKRFGIALPRICPNCRSSERIAQSNPIKFYFRQCMCENTEHNNHSGVCTVNFQTSYSPDRPEIVYCEKCYQQEVY